MQSPCLYRGGISTIHVYSHTHKQLQVDLHQLNKSILICLNYLDYKNKKIPFIEYLFHEVSTASSRQSAKYLPKFPQLSIPIRN